MNKYNNTDLAIITNFKMLKNDIMSFKLNLDGCKSKRIQFKTTRRLNNWLDYICYSIPFLSRKSVGSDAFQYVTLEILFHLDKSGGIWDGPHTIYCIKQVFSDRRTLTPLTVDGNVSSFKVYNDTDMIEFTITECNGMIESFTIRPIRGDEREAIMLTEQF